MRKEILYHGYKLTYYLFPGKTLTKPELLDVHQNILDMNIESGRNFKYGIFDHNKPFAYKKDFYDKILLTTIHDENGESAGFFYNYLIPTHDTYLIHQGLAVIFKNKGVDLLKDPHMYANIILYDYLQKDFFVSTISAVPLVIGVFSDIFESVWPSITAQDIRFSPKQYQELAQVLYNTYVINFFPEGTVFDKKRFVLKSPLKEMGFGLNIKDLPRHSNWHHNLFAYYWLDLSQGEDLVQIGKLTKIGYEDHLQHLKNVKFLPNPSPNSNQNQGE